MIIKRCSDSCHCLMLVAAGDRGEKLIFIPVCGIDLERAVFLKNSFKEVIAEQIIGRERESSDFLIHLPY